VSVIVNNNGNVNLN